MPTAEALNPLATPIDLGRSATAAFTRDQGARLSALDSFEGCGRAARLAVNRFDYGSQLSVFLADVSQAETGVDGQKLVDEVEDEARPADSDTEAWIAA